MAKKITAAAVPMLKLTPQEETNMRRLAAQLQQEILAQYEEYVFCDQRKLDASKWKLKRSDGDIHAYKERKAKQNRPVAKVEPGPHRKLAEQSVLPRVLITGTIPGTLDDAMYGSCFQDTPSVQRFWAAQGERVEESAVVATLDGPSVDDPYQFLGVAWYLRTYALNLLHRRDCLQLTSFGVSQISNGERVGITIGHSIEHRDLAELHEFNTIRVTSSILKVHRQLDQNRVEVFVLHFLDTKGIVPDYAHVQESLTHLMPITKSTCEAGFRKKLGWLLYRRKRSHLDSASWEAIEPQSSGTNESCELCDKRLGALFTSPGTSCELCYQRVCSNCSVQHDLLMPSTEGRTTSRAHDFCVQCSLSARSMSTLSVAQQDAQYRRSSSNSSTDSRGRGLTTLMSADSLLS